jgi:hypothetical protein
VLQTVVRPTAGGLVFSAGASAETVTVSDPGEQFNGRGWVPIVIALVVHLLKATARPVLSTVTAGAGAPVVSTAEDASSVVLSLVAIVVPILVMVLVVGLAALWWWAIRRRRRRRQARRVA